MSAAWRRALLIAGGALLVALTVGLVGLLPTRASVDHWAVTKWFLDFFKTRSVSLYASGVTAPPLDDPRRVARGAAYYETGCMSCHGGPDRPASRVAEAMTPPPPRLEERIPRWSAAELFHITKHGIKFTGMPAWIALGRDDEVWDVVAFLVRLPTLDSAAYRRLAWGESGSTGSPALGEQAPADGPDVPPTVLEDCARCHGPDGNGRGGAFPRLAGQKRAYLAAALDAFARDRRHSGMMQPIATAVPHDVREKLAAHYAALAPARAAEPGGDPDTVARGGELAARGDPTRRIPACVQCHGPAAAPRNDHYPHLAGQPRWYLERQLRRFREGQRGGSPYAPLMHEVATRLDDAHIREVAAWYASLDPNDGR